MTTPPVPIPIVVDTREQRPFCFDPARATRLHSRTTAAIVIRTNPGRCHVAHVIAYASDPDDITTETIAIASALYWSWWSDRSARCHRSAREEGA